VERPFPLTCRCGETWSEEHWSDLPLIGVYRAGRDGNLELRACFCRATLAVPLTSELTTGNGVAKTVAAQ
jgi:hypothetical protein